MPPTTPDGRYIVVHGVLWRAARPDLPAAERAALVNDLMAARRSIAHARDEDQVKEARVRVDAAKRALGERGPVWWTDGAPDLNRHKVTNTPYRDWWVARDGAQGG